jgi:starch synthase (maltosyl-transferring)
MAKGKRPPAEPQPAAAQPRKRATAAESAGVATPVAASTSAPAPAAPMPTASPGSPAPSAGSAPAPGIRATPIAAPEGRSRAVIDALLPVVDGGRFPAKRIAGEPVRIEAHCITDGQDRLRAVLRWQAVDGAEVHELDMAPLPNDVWWCEFTPPVPGRYRYTVVAWVDHFESWRHELERRRELEDIRIALRVGAELAEQAATRAAGEEAGILARWAGQLRSAAAGDGDSIGPDELKNVALEPARIAVAARHPDRTMAATRSLELVADRKTAQFSSWYEMFPRSAAPDSGRHGTFRDVEARLPYVAEMGFDVLYFPPIHPIGIVNRKGKNNALAARPDDIGSPWAIGSADGGHKDIHRELGTLEDFRSLTHKARELGIEIALDIAFQCAPDHPYVKAHPQWFKHRPDGSIQYAENPPKKYQDIYPFDFESADWRALWVELKSVFDFWIAQGVKIFRVDNPHTKPFEFWEWAIAEITRVHPDVIFLAEAFTRPKVMHRLAKVGFTQSYTYFTWRNSKYELTEYFTELASGPGRDYYRPNVWPNTPDILHEALQLGLRPLFAARLVLAATLSANYGIYGPAFELMESQPRESGSEEYIDSEKYQLRHWDLTRADSLRYLIARMNRIRKDNPPLQADHSLRFCRIDNEALIAYLKSDSSGAAILTIVNLDPYKVQSGWVDLDLSALQLDDAQPYQVHDLLSEQRYLWRGRYNYVMLDPQRAPAHVFKLRRLVRKERDFDYFR